MSNQLKTLRSAFLATTAMTAFSYLFSYLSGNNTREPELLAKMTYRLFPLTSRPTSRIIGWTAHYTVGLLFAELYARLWERSPYKPSPKSGLVFGGLSGLAAILIWKFTLDAHPLPPAVSFTTFAVNLLFAHLIFGLFAALGYKDISP
ncbi:MAG: hypothetical protein JST68_29490 [Bacteroidetes bacterium]|nr:hypothetical protein [Bacteroidota bacterium]